MKQRQKRPRRVRLELPKWVCLVLVACKSIAAQSATLPPAVDAALARGEAQTVLVLLDGTTIDAAAVKLRAPYAHSDNEAVLAFKVREYSALKERSHAWNPKGDADIALDYSHLPMMLVRFRTAAAAKSFAAHKEIIGIYEDKPLYPTLAQSLPLVGQPTVVNSGYSGSGTTVVVLDSGINYTLAEFGSCTAPGVPATCRVVVAQDLAPDDGSLDDSGHGTNVAGIVAGVAPGTLIAAFDVFTGTAASSSIIISGINWAIANKAAYNIVAINMSLGDGVRYKNTCASSPTNPFLTPITSARSAGILSVISSGNNQYLDGITSPACTPNAISVGAVYDANVGAISYSGLCSETGTSADKVACFSNSASFLTLLAPGALITAGGATQAGTSQAAPHVAGAVAVLRAEFTSDTVDQTVSRMVNTGISVLDTRNNITKPRLNLLAAARPDGDTLTGATPLSAATGQISSGNALASKQAGEPNHAGNSGGASMWFAWIAPSTGSFLFTTQGSSFDTLLAIYQGTAVDALTAIASNNDNGAPGGVSSVAIDAVAGQTYLIAIDGNNGATGTISLTWNSTPIESTDIPVLPPLGMLAMLFGLAAVGLKRQRSR